MDEDRNELHDDVESGEIIARYEDMIRKNTRYFFDVEEFTQVIDYYIENNRPSSALRAIEIANSQHPNASEIQLKKAQVLMNTGRKTEALNLLKHIERGEPHNADVFLLKGMLYLLTENLKDALKNFEQAVSLTFEEKCDILLSVAISLENAGKFEQAVSFLERAYELEPDNEDVLYEMAYSLETLENYKESAVFYKKYLDEDPYAAFGWYNLGMVYIFLGELEKSVEAFDFALAIDADFTSAWFSKARAFEMQGNFETAIKIYEEYLADHKENIDALYFIGECHEKTEAYDTALEYYKKVLAADETFSDAWMGTGYISFQKNDFPQALDAVNKALGLEPDNPDFLLLRAWIYAKLELFSEAESDYSKIAELDKTDDEAFLSWAEMVFQLNNIEKAITILKDAYQDISFNAAVDFRLAGYYLLLHKDTSSVLKYLETGFNKKPEQVEEFHNIVPDIELGAEISKLIDSYKTKS